MRTVGIIFCNTVRPYAAFLILRNTMNNHSCMMTCVIACISSFDICFSRYVSDVLEVNAGRARQNLPPLPHEEMFGRAAVASIGPSNNLVTRGLYAKMIMKWLHYFPLRYYRNGGTVESCRLPLNYPQSRNLKFSLLDNSILSTATT